MTNLLCRNVAQVKPGHAVDPHPRLLRKAIELAMDALKKTKPLLGKRPAYPVYN